jgi:hypothetical protein
MRYFSTIFFFLALSACSEYRDSVGVTPKQFDDCNVNCLVNGGLKAAGLTGVYYDSIDHLHRTVFCTCANGTSTAKAYVD